MSTSSHTLPLQMLYHWADASPHQTYLHQPRDGRWHEHSWSSVLEMAARLVTGLSRLGLTPGDKVAILSKNCAEWFICDFALQMGGYVSVPIYPTAGADTVNYVLEHSESRAVFVGKLDDAEQQAPGIPDGLLRLAMPYDSSIRTDHDWDSLLVHEPISERPVPEPERLMTLVYTSGSTGKPKGVMITHGAYAAACQGVLETTGLNADDRAFSYLPLAHITERVYILGSSLYAGAQVGFAQSLDSFIDNVKTISPTVFISVPRLWTNFRSGILDKVPASKLNLLLRIPLLSGLVKKKIQTGLGLDQARILGCGSAPIAPALLRWYERLGMPITEAWGMTENLAYSTLNYPFRSDKVGTVGRPGAGVEIRISEQGEVLCRCDGMMQGYYKDEEATRAALQDGWLHTGDQGRLDDDGYLTLTGRLKDAFKTAKGKYVLPVPIESQLIDNPLIEQVCVVGSGLAQPVALVQLADSAAARDRDELATALGASIEQVNHTLESHQRLGGMLVMKDAWTVENHIMTPTLKIKRHLLEQQYQDLDQRWVKGNTVLWEQDLAPS
ncbi:MULTISPECIES: AMP-binding protein [Oceanimonas]|uniref:AMP-dependent synthetase n=1 Tax=Oceanimonas doudoroffii TaxID=84158 RepID=A0A233RHC6_9GAMM|nr:MULTISPECIES: AMP-binding protein [Oceanimonas]NHI00632.1 Long-chain-fatty-acid--CoA ligase FadD15 [Oceanimonas sp. MB9]OXY82774.1 AMP-dependent synthetase [Oceanimonas doudoroffii]